MAAWWPMLGGSFNLQLRESLLYYRISICMFDRRLHTKSNECFERPVGNDENGDICTIIGAVDANANQAKIHAKSKSKLSPEAESLVPRVILQEPLVISDTGNKICVAQVPSKEKRAYEAASDPARPHKCWVCQAAFRKISHLKQHHRRHTGERPYKCTKCDRCVCKR